MDTELKQDEQPISRIIISFVAPGSATMAIDFQNVSPLQAAAAAWYLEKQAQSGLIAQDMARREQEAMKHIAVPGGGAPRKVVTRP